MPTYRLTVNNQSRTVDVPADMPLLWVVRDLLGLTGTKFGCGVGSCGACTVHLDGRAERSCQLPMEAVGASKITTIEGLSADGGHPLQTAWQTGDVPQCGYCQAGQLMQASSMLAAHPHPTDEDIDREMAGNLCRCGTYQRIRAAIHAAADGTPPRLNALGALGIGAGLAALAAPDGRRSTDEGSESGLSNGRHDPSDAGELAGPQSGNGYDKASGNAQGDGHGGATALTQPVLTRRAVVKGAVAFQLALTLRDWAPLAPTIVNASPSAGGLDGAVDTAPKAEPAALSAWIAVHTDDTISITVSKSEMGQGVRTSLAMIVAEEMDADWTKVEVVQADANRVYGNQGTVGSSSVSGMWQTLRVAGATARSMMVQAAAQTWGVAPDSCRTEPCTVVHPASGRRLTYGALAEAAAKLPVPGAGQVALKSAADFRIVGKPTLRVDNADVVTGRAGYGIDARTAGMLHAVVARCPVFGGRVGRFDDSKAKAVPGVKQVVQIQTGIAVVADNTWAAMKGREALEITWSEGANAGLNDAGIRDSLAAAIKAFPDLPGEGKAVEATYDLPFLAHATMEPMNCLADVRADGATIWAPTQSPGGVQQSVAQGLRLAPETVTVHVTLMGGGFGRRSGTDFAIEAASISKAVGAPIQLTWTRDDDMQHDYYRPASRHVLRGAIDNEGRVLAWQHHGAMSQGGGNSAPPYNVRSDNDMASARVPVPTGAWRSVAMSQIVFANESFVDELAAAADADPFAYRRDLLTNNRLRGVLVMAADKAGWGTPLPSGSGRGIACMNGFGSNIAVVAEVSVDAAGHVRVRRVVAAVDCGTAINPRTVEAQVQGAIVDGLSTALGAQINIDRGRAVQGNFTYAGRQPHRPSGSGSGSPDLDYTWFRINDMPTIDVHIVPSNASPGGIGEVGYPATPPALANAIFAATGRRVRRLPILPADLAGWSGGALPTEAPTAAPRPTQAPPQPTTAPTAAPTQPAGPTVAPQGRVYLPRVDP